MPHLSIEKIIDIKKQRRTQNCAVPIYWNPFGLVLVPAAEKPPLKLYCSFACYRTKREKHHELVEAELPPSQSHQTGLVPSCSTASSSYLSVLSFGMLSLYSVSAICQVILHKQVRSHLCNFTKGTDFYKPASLNNCF